MCKRKEQPPSTVHLIGLNHPDAFSLQEECLPSLSGLEDILSGHPL